MKKKFKILAVVSARSGSKGVPNKNIRKLGDIPLIAHSIKTAISSNLFSAVIVSTENTKIARISKQYGADVPFFINGSIQLGEGVGEKLTPLKNKVRGKYLKAIVIKPPFIKNTSLHA